MKPIKILKPKQYERFCSTWQTRLTKKFPKGMPITRENLVWIYKKSENISKFALNCSMGMDCFTDKRVGDYFYRELVYSGYDIRNLITILLNVCKTGKLTITELKRQGLKNG